MPDEFKTTADRKRRTWRAGLWPVLLFALVALVHTQPLFVNFDNWGIEDWDQHFFYHAVPRATIIQHQQIPLWNPYYCGGAPLLANPQSRVLAPTFGILLIFDVVRGLKIEVFLNLVIGMSGMYALARGYGLSGAAAVLPPVVYMLSTMYSLILASGATNFLSIAWLPWTVWAFVRSFDRPRYAVAAGLFLALTYLSGGHWVVPIVVLFLALYFVLGLFSHGVRQSVQVLLLTGVTGLGFGAIKILPSAEVMRRYPRQIQDYSGYSIEGLGAMMLDRDQRLERFVELEQKPGFWSGFTMEMSENGMYIGIVPLVLCLAGVVARVRREWKLGVTLLVFLWFCLGSRAPLSLWDALHRLAVYDSLQMAMRFRIILVLCIALFCGFGLRWFSSWVADRTRKDVAARLASVFVVAWVVVDMVLVTRPIFAATFPIRPDTVMSEIEPNQKFLQVRRLPVYDASGLLSTDWFDDTPLADVPVDASYSALYPAFLTNRGTVFAYEAIPFPRHALPSTYAAYRGEQFLDDMKGTVSLRSWSPNRLEYAVQAYEEDTLVVNQNFGPNWVVSGAASDKPVSEGGLLAARVAPETTRVVFTYRPASFAVGALVTGLTVIGSVIALVWLRRRDSHMPEAVNAE